MKDAYHLCMSRLSTVKMDGKVRRRYFFYIESEDLQTIRNTDAVTVFKGCTSMYCFRAEKGQMIHGRELSCFCSPCRNAMGSGRGYDGCLNKDHAGVWVGQNITCAAHENVKELTLDEHGIMLASELHFRDGRKDKTFIAVR